MADQQVAVAPEEIVPIMNGHSRSQSIESEQAIEGIESPNNGSRNSRESSRLTGTVKWFNAKAGYGFVTRHDTGDDIFVHFSGIARKNPRHSMKSLGDGEHVEFNLTATNVTGPHGRPVRGNPYVSYLPIHRTDSYASGDPIMFPRGHRYISTMDAGDSRIPRYIPNWQTRY